MKVIKQANGKKTLKMSKSEWLTMGKKAGWVEADLDDDMFSAHNESDPECPECDETMDHNGDHWVCPACQETLGEDNFQEPDDDAGSYEVDAKEWGGMDIPDSPY